MGAISSLEEFVAASQRAQLRGLQVMIEHARRNKGRTGGVIFWQLNDPWPAISWSVVDYYRTPKPAYYKIRELYNPLLVSFYYELKPRRPGDRVDGELWAINDTSSLAGGRWTAHLNRAFVAEGTYEVGPNTAAVCAVLSTTLASGENRLELTLSSGEAIVATNEYDLNYSDRGEIFPLVAPLQKVAARLQS
jgi:hypothetical protein